jgi:ribosomal protein S18 acetylase RimI-like enzyme
MNPDPHLRAVRRIRTGESELFKQMRLASLRESPFAFGSTYESAVQRRPESWAEQADGTARGSDRSTFIAFCGEAPTGIAALYRIGEGSDVGELLQVWVSPEHRSQGVAVDLMDAVFQWAGENGFRTVVACVRQENARALRFYQEYGFAPANSASGGGPDDLVVLAKGVADAQAAGVAAPG